MATAGGPPGSRPGGVAVRPARPPSRPARPPSRPARPPSRPAAPGPVSSTSAQRFASRVRSRRRRRVVIGVVVCALLAAAVWGALRSPWATVQTVEVSGTHRISAATVRAAGERETGHALLLARVHQVHDEIAAMRLVRSVVVTRVWPSTLRISVVERVPVAAVPIDAQDSDNSIGKQSPMHPGGKRSTPGRATAKTAAKTLRLVDRDGFTITTASQAPSTLPVINVDPGTSRGAKALQSCLAVLAGLPSGIHSQLTAIGAISPDGVWLRLRSGARVQWGGPDQGAFKATVLTALLKQPGTEYDLRAPENPAIRRK